MIEFNVNETVKYKPTKRGQEVHKANHDRIFAGQLDRFPYRPIKVDEDGWASDQMWALIESFGNDTHMGCNPCFETTILLKERTE